MRPRLERALSFSVFTGLVLLGDYVHRLRSQAEAAAAPEGSGHAGPPRHSRARHAIPWVISFLSLTALVIVVLTTR